MLAKWKARTQGFFLFFSEVDTEENLNIPGQSGSDRPRRPDYPVDPPSGGERAAGHPVEGAARDAQDRTSGDNVCHCSDKQAW